MRIFVGGIYRIKTVPTGIKCPSCGQEYGGEESDKVWDGQVCSILRIYGDGEIPDVECRCINCGTPSPNEFPPTAATSLIVKVSSDEFHSYHLRVPLSYLNMVEAT